MTDLCRKFADSASKLQDRVLKQLARELLLAQSSDWAFLMKTGTARRVRDQTDERSSRRASIVCTIELAAGDVDETFLSDCESRDNLFRQVNWRYYV